MQVYPQKFEENGKKYVMCKEPGGSVEVAELASIGDVLELMDSAEKPGKLVGTIELSKDVVEVDEAFTYTGKFALTEAGEHRLMLYDWKDNQFSNHLDTTITVKEKDTNGDGNGDENGSDLVNSQEVLDALLEGFGSNNVWEVQFGDRGYYKADIPLLLELIKPISSIRYSKHFDCDNFSFGAMGKWNDEIAITKGNVSAMAKFVIWIMWKKGDKNLAHALNSAYDGSLKLIEPQTRRVSGIPSKEKNVKVITFIG